MPQYMPRAAIPNVEGVDDFVRAYLECAEWAGILPTDPEDSTGESGQQALELSVSPAWDTESVRLAVEACADFRHDAGSLLNGIDEEAAGHDLWLTRNGHGAGFWDRGLGRRGERLTKLAHTLGEAHVTFDPESETLTLEDY